MTKYEMFKKLLGLMEEIGQVTDADMNRYGGGMEIACECGEQVISIDVNFRRKKEETENA